MENSMEVPQETKNRSGSSGKKACLASMRHWVQIPLLPPKKQMNVYSLHSSRWMCIALCMHHNRILEWYPLICSKMKLEDIVLSVITQVQKRSVPDNLSDMWVLKKSWLELGMVVRACNPSTQEAEARVSLEFRSSRPAWVKNFHLKKLIRMYNNDY
jgi:hypothetical protein